ncbi:glycosyltransferase [Affinibrenneria salicis]|uniref:Glycosyltransferase n=1 Tax=Affinibrenneria salicis TaxID=2590031 RepID=A0A5J5G0N9_9GAMM|nr:glycosyltransferase family A protein [Affinibrenneria salicis]KAA8999856.1 glycosyltransferase [Affinibrenneria salicis]
MKNVTVIIPTCNGGSVWEKAAKKISLEKDKYNFNVFVIDSESTDNTIKIAKKLGFEVKSIRRSDFNHGGTRNKAFNLSNSEFFVFLTQDAIPEKDAIKNIISFLDKNKNVCCTYGKQIPHDTANPLAIHARFFNYKKNSYITGLSVNNIVGVRKVFSSNSFSAYRANYFHELGGFPSHTILSEDMYLAAKSILAGYNVAYVANAVVKHSHNYTPWEEFKRYFDIGVFHYDEKWIRDNFGGAGSEGKKFIVSEFKYLLKNNPLWIPRACLHNLLKITGYKLGQNYTKLPIIFVKKLSMHKGFWNKTNP